MSSTSRRSIGLNPAFELVASRGVVEFWSHKRLPLSPTGDLAIGVVALRSALKDLASTADQRLLAQFISTSTGFFDVENVLLYNVGTGVFKFAAPHGVHVQRILGQPLPAPSGRTFSNLHRYTPEALSTPPRSPPSFSFELPKLNSATKWFDIWWAARSGKRAFAESEAAQAFSGRFRLDITVPSSSKNLAGVVKQLLDGVICSMHAPDDVDMVAVQRLAGALKCTTEDVNALMLRPVFPVLPSRPIVVPNANFVRADPADDLCTEFVVDRSESSSRCDVWVSPLYAGPI